MKTIISFIILLKGKLKATYVKQPQLFRIIKITTEVNLGRARE